MTKVTIDMNKWEALSQIMVNERDALLDVWAAYANVSQNAVELLGYDELGVQSLHDLLDKIGLLGTRISELGSAMYSFKQWQLLPNKEEHDD